MEKFASCRFAYFLSYGLRAKPRRPAEFKAPETGTFIHYILQHVAEDTAAEGGLAGAESERLAALTEEYARTIYADAYCRDAMASVNYAERVFAGIKGEI